MIVKKRRRKDYFMNHITLSYKGSSSIKKITNIYSIAPIFWNKSEFSKYINV